MSRIHAVCSPSSDSDFAERVRHVVAEEGWDLDSPEGIAVIQAVLRQSYPLATVRAHGVSAGSVHRTLVLDVARDGKPVASDVLARWTEMVYNCSGANAYRAAARTVGEGPAAESVVEQAFRQVQRAIPAVPSVEQAGAAVETAAAQLAAAFAARVAERPEPASADGSAERHADDRPPVRGNAHRALTAGTLASLLSLQREALELVMLEGLKVPEAAERMRLSCTALHRTLREALQAVAAGAPLSPLSTLARWHEAYGSWAQLGTDDPGRADRASEMAHAWLDHQTVSGVVPPETVVVVTDVDRRFVATSANAARTFGRPSLSGLRLDDVTADYVAPLLDELWTVFRGAGRLDGEYDCARLGMTPIRLPFRGDWGQPVPGLQVAYFRPPVAAAAAPFPVVDAPVREAWAGYAPMAREAAGASPG